MTALGDFTLYSGGHRGTEAEFGLQLSATVAWNHPTTNQMASHLLSRLVPDGDEPEPASPTGENAPGPTAHDVAALSDEDALAALLDTKDGA